MIEKLGWDGERIFIAKIVNGGLKLKLAEACDDYFNCELTKEEVIELANDFLKLAEQMK